MQHTAPNSRMHRIEEILFKPQVLFTLGALAVIAMVIAGEASHRTMNYEIFRLGTLDPWSGTNPYTEWYHPGRNGEELDRFLYPPLFSVLFIPLALLPIWLGSAIWCIGSYAALFRTMRLTKGYRSSDTIGDLRRFGAVFYYTILVVILSLKFYQYNTLNAVFCLLTLYLLEHKRFTWAMIVVVIGGCTKVYPGFCALLFLFYPDFWQSPKLLIRGVVILLVALLLPALYTGMNGLLPYYKDWWSMMEARDLWMFQGISAFMYRILGWEWVTRYVSVMLLLGMILPIAAYLLLHRKRNFSYHEKARILGILMMGLMVWGNSTEPNTYLIGMLGWMLFYHTLPHPRPILAKVLGWGLFISYAVVPMDFLCPVWLSRLFLQEWKIGALIGFLVWCYMVYIALRNANSQMDGMCTIRRKK